MIYRRVDNYGAGNVAMCSKSHNEMEETSEMPAKQTQSGWSEAERENYSALLPFCR